MPCYGLLRGIYHRAAPCVDPLIRNDGFYGPSAPPLLRNPIYCSSTNTPVAIAWATTKASPRMLGITAPENNSAMLARVHAALPAITIITSTFGMDCRVPSQPTSAV